MKLIYNNRSNAYTTHYKTKRNAQGEASSKLPQNKASQNQINFNGALKTTKIIPYADKIITGIDEVLGDGYFANKLNLTGFLDDTSKQIHLPVENFLSETGHAAIKTAINLISIPLDIINSICKKLGKEIPEGILKIRNNAVQKEQAQEIVQDILAKFLKDTNNVSNLTEDAVQGLADKFRKTAALNITDINASYHSADERALNRIGTSFVSAIFSGYDFYNITMLQKDDSNEAKKEERKRFNLDFTRCFANAAITFILMSLFEKPLNKNMGLSAGTLVASSLISETLTRIKKGEPLKRLTPEEAREIAQRRKNKNTKKENEKIQENKSNNKEISFNDFLTITNPSKNIAFSSSKNMQVEDVKTNNKKDKDASLLKSIVKIMSIASLVFLAAEALNGNLPAKIKRLKIHEANPNGFDDETIKTIKDTFSKNVKKSEEIGILKKLTDAITKTNADINLTELKEQLAKISKDKNLPIVEEYIELIDERIIQEGTKIYKEAASGDIYLRSTKNIPVVSAIVEGVSRLFKNVYQILSFPGRIINFILDSTVFKDSELKTKKYKIKYSDKQIETLNNIIRKAKTNKEAINTIEENIRNFKEKPETGELASLSRTLITVITSWFMINDYSNKVLIESEGRDVEGAEEERVDRLMQKISNFFFNGTLMNMTNTLFKGPLNRSLLAATIIPMLTEWANQVLVRKSICQPAIKINSKEAIEKYELEQLEQKGFMGWWSKTYRKLTGKKTLTQKAGIDKKKLAQQDKTNATLKTHQG
ncbi:MAG: hypothetical protein IKU37_02740 [Candidatus Gastranaerophilales bacterium]|nr:hypothetical protein [Candidatus Gastranaerophilales bacterium]